MNISTHVQSSLDPQPAPPRRLGAPKGNSNARKHGFYSKSVADSLRRELDSVTPYRGEDLEIVLALWQAARVIDAVPGRDLLHDAALRRLFALVRQKYGLGRRDRETLQAVFLRLCFDLVLTVSLQIRLAAAQVGAHL